MKESRESYYDILGVSQKATLAEIKRAYFELCKNYHPDKLPFDMPNGARKYIQERMIIINEAYEVLKDESNRKNYDEQLILYDPPKQNIQHQQHESDRDFQNLFEESILKQAAKQLEDEVKKVEDDFGAEIRRIEKKYERHLQSIKQHQPGNVDVMDSSSKLERVIIFVIAIFISLWLLPVGGIVSFVGWIGLILFVISGVAVILSPTYKPDYVKEVKHAKEKRDKQNHEIRAIREKKLQYFKTIPISSINYDFVSRLSAVDRFFLLKAMQER